MDLLRGKEYLLIRKEDQQLIHKEERDGFSYKFIMAQNMPGSTVEMMIVTLLPEANSKLSVESGFKLNYILSGRCDYYVNEEIIQLEEGDTLYFDSGKSHMPVNRGQQAVIILSILFRN